MGSPGRRRGVRGPSLSCSNRRGSSGRRWHGQQCRGWGDIAVGRCGDGIRAPEEVFGGNVCGGSCCREADAPVQGEGRRGAIVNVSSRAR